MADLSFFADLFSFLVHIDRHLYELANHYGAYLYLLLFLVVFCETGLVVTPFLPGDSLLFATGAVAGADYLNYPLCLGVLWLAAVLGDAVNYEIGHHIGINAFRRPHRFLKKEYLYRAQDFYEKYGGKAIVLARFVPILRTFAPFVAGIANMRPSQFFTFNLLGGALWVGALVSAGYFLGNLPLVKNNFSIAIYLIIFLSLLPPCLEYLSLRRRRNTDEPHA